MINILKAKSASNQVSETEYLEAQLENLRFDMAQQGQMNNMTLTSESLQDLLTVSSNMGAGIAVNANTAPKASALLAGVRLIATAIASLPVEIFEKKGDLREHAVNHALARMLDVEPNPLVTSFTFWEACLWRLILRGNFYALILRRMADPVSLVLLKSEQVIPFKKDGRILYQVQFDEGNQVVFDQDDMIHVPGLGWDGIKGKSIIEYGAETIGITLAADDHSGRFFSEGAIPSGVISYDKKVNKEQAEIILESFEKRHQKRQRPAIITDGGSYEQTTISARDAQLLESRRFQVEDIARLLGVPPHMIGHTEKTTSWGSGIEQMGIAFVTYTLRPYLKKIEKELARKLFRDDRHVAKFNVAGLLRGDTKARNESYQIALGGNQQPGWMTINEVRRLEGLPPVDGGNQLYKPLTGEPNNAQTEE